MADLDVIYNPKDATCMMPVKAFPDIETYLQSLKTAERDGELDELFPQEMPETFIAYLLKDMGRDGKKHVATIAAAYRITRNDAGEFTYERIRRQFH